MRDEAEALLTEAMSLLAEQQRLLRQEMQGAEEYSPDLSRQAQALGRTAAVLGNEVRKHQSTLEQAAKKTTPDERAEAAERWLMRLPPDLLKPIVGRLLQKLKKRP